MIIWDTRPRRLALIGCGAAKAAAPAVPRDLYTGPLFRDALAWAETQGFDRVLVLSAKHGVLCLDCEPIQPYDTRLEDLLPDEKYRLAHHAREAIKLCGNYRRGELTILAGADYAELVRPLALDGWTLHEPLRGLGIFERRRWFAEQRTEVTP